jgi:predicted ArsR family transcriptional regulator
MKSTRDEIAALLRQRPEWTVAELAEQLDIAPAAARRHLEILAAEGTVEHRSVKQATGRPYFAYRLTEQAREAAANGYPRLLERFVSGVVALGPEETATVRDGRQILDSVFGQMSESLAADYRDRVHGDTVEERVQSLTDALRGEGLVDTWEKRPDGFHLATHACPHRRAALLTSGLCTAEARAIERLLGANVEQTARLVEGAPFCEYLVREPVALSTQPSLTAEQQIHEHGR